MPGGQRRRFIQEEQLSPTARSHDGAADAAPVESANQPGPAGPTAFEQGASLRIVDDAAISSKASTLGDSDDVTHGRNAILERHAFKALA